MPQILQVSIHILVISAVCSTIILLVSCNDSKLKKSDSENDTIQKVVDKPKVLKIITDSVFSIEVHKINEKFDVNRIVLKMRNTPIFINEDSRNGVGNMVNYNGDRDSIYFKNPVMIDSFVIFVTNFYSNQLCHIINVNNANSVVVYNASYFYFINDISNKSILFFSGDKMKYLEHEMDLAEIIRVSYTGKKIDKVYVPFRELMESYNLFGSGKVDSNRVLSILGKFRR